MSKALRLAKNLVMTKVHMTVIKKDMLTPFMNTI